MLNQELNAEFEEDKSSGHGRNLQALSYAAPAVQNIMASPLLDYVLSHPDIMSERLGYVISIWDGATDTQFRARASALAVERLLSDQDLSRAALYGSFAVVADPPTGVAALERRLGDLAPNQQTALVESLLPLIFGDSRSPLETERHALPFVCLLKILRIAYSTVRIREDRERPSGEAYSPELRDRAQWARSAAFKQLARTPGRATFEALLELTAVPDLGLDADHLKTLARERAEADCEHAPWPPQAAKQFEDSKESAPRTTVDLQRVAVSRLEDLQHDLLHDNFAQARTLKLLPDEAMVQGWVAETLDQDKRKGVSFTVDREPEVVDGKAPDYQLRARQSDARLPIEVKVAETWSYADLKAALALQLCGQYLRSQDAPHGILLLVHQQTRPLGWHDEWGAYMDFPAVIQRLREHAAGIAGQDPSSPQPVVAVLDVSTIALRSARRKAKRKQTPKMKSIKKKAAKRRAAKKKTGNARPRKKVVAR